MYNESTIEELCAEKRGKTTTEKQVKIDNGSFAAGRPMPFRPELRELVTNGFSEHSTRENAYLKQFGHFSLVLVDGRTVYEMVLDGERVEVNVDMRALAESAMALSEFEESMPITP